MLALPGLCGNPFSALTAFTNKTDGTIVFAADWNNVIGALYTYISNTLLPQLNVLANKGDIYVYNGTAIVALGAGSNGQVLTANSATSSGLQYTTVSGTGPLTTKGDIETVNGSGTAVRLPIGTNGQVLTANSAASNGFGVDWETTGAGAVPSGTIVMFYGMTIPAGWNLCDGTNGTPNMIGMFPLGAQYSGGTSTANSNGFGNTIYNTVYGATTHNHTFSNTANTGANNSSGSVQAAGTNPVLVPGQGHTHQVTISGTTSNASLQPACIGLVFIQKV